MIIYSVADVRGDIRYIGWTAAPLRCRIDDHRNSAKRSHFPFHQWLKNNLDTAQFRELEKIPQEHFCNPTRREDYWIWRHRFEGSPLLNQMPKRLEYLVYHALVADGVSVPGDAPIIAGLGLSLYRGLSEVEGIKPPDMFTPGKIWRKPAQGRSMPEDFFEMERVS